jgi:hypothetical protein
MCIEPQFGHHQPDVRASGDAMSMSAMRAGNEIPTFQGADRSYGGSFLPD